MSSSLALTEDALLPDEPLERIPCPVCQKDTPRQCFRSEDVLYGAKGSYPVVECTSCGLRYVSPRPTLEALGRHYPSDYFASRPPEQMGRIAGAFHKASLVSAAVKRIRSMERVIGKLTPGTRLVDVGCGLNELVLQAKRLRGCDGIGVEFNPAVVEYVREKRGLPMVQGTLGSAELGDGEFDVVSMMEYLEHEPNPRDVLHHARRVVKTGGHIVIEIPYIHGIPGRLFGPRWGALDVPRHLVFYSEDTLERILREHGFRLVHHRTFGIPLSIGISLAVAAGHRHLNSMSTAGMLLMSLAALPFVPFTPFLKEFMFAVAKAE